MANNFDNLTTEQREQLIKAGIITEDAVTQEIQVKQPEFDDMPELIDFSDFLPADSLDYLAKVVKFQKEIEGPEDSDELDQFVRIAGASKQLQELVLESAKDEEEMKAWLRKGSGFNKLLFALDQISEQAGKGIDFD